MPLRCLLVDDNEAFLETASLLLNREGVTVVGVASSIAEALRQARVLRPDVILVDIGLGDESGFDLARLLAQDGQDGGAAVILISTGAEADYAELIAESRRPDSWRSRSCRRGASAGSSATRRKRRASGPAWCPGPSRPPRSVRCSPSLLPPVARRPRTYAAPPCPHDHASAWPGLPGRRPARIPASRNLRVQASTVDSGGTQTYAAFCSSKLSLAAPELRRRSNRAARDRFAGLERGSALDSAWK